MTATPYGDLEIGAHELTIDGVPWIVDVSAAGCAARMKNPPTEPRTIWPYEFIALLTDTQLAAIQTSDAVQLIRMRTQVQTLVSPMPFDETSQLYQGVLYLGYVMPGIFTAPEVSRILAGVAP